ncbi:hypothetical protein ACFFLZ_06310 [Photobacterium aphoticum]|uniref:Uncharacterized protein n=1 Tax=Photobacterium aphoticum TaxID=754436 RepID=A0A0J1GRB2_9GAMM|nr:hypothetical protein [Photobacterium aphoticum]KLV01979.1 hypothetical protein ABT58_06225 [Photobacterium aphoticum]PSU60225.1 hypothetical protein C9I90_00980 [Photobacterium aphoticum]GHA34188.1 hypothetical protein GCM10007086_04440 [Photobacterium aphoticum]
MLNTFLRTLVCLLVFLLLMLAPLQADAAKKDKAKQCKKVQNKITAIQKKMRSPYTTKQGVRYHKTLNKLYKEAFSYCH